MVLTRLKSDRPRSAQVGWRARSLRWHPRGRFHRRNEVLHRRPSVSQARSERIGTIPSERIGAIQVAPPSPRSCSTCRQRCTSFDANAYLGPRPCSRDATNRTVRPARCARRFIVQGTAWTRAAPPALAESQMSATRRAHEKPWTLRRDPTPCSCMCMLEGACNSSAMHRDPDGRRTCSQTPSRWDSILLFREIDLRLGLQSLSGSHIAI